MNHRPQTPISAAVTGLTLSLLSAGMLLTATQSVQAQQTGSSADLQSPVGASDLNSQTNGNFGTLGNMFDLMHRAQQGGIRDSYEFGRSQQESLNTAASEYRQRQLELLRQRGQSGASPASQNITPASPMTSPASPTSAP